MLLQLKVKPSIGLKPGAWASLWTSDAPFHGPIGKFLNNLILTIFFFGLLFSGYCACAPCSSLWWVPVVTLTRPTKQAIQDATYASRRLQRIGHLCHPAHTAGTVQPSQSSTY